MLSDAEKDASNFIRRARERGGRATLLVTRGEAVRHLVFRALYVLSTATEPINTGRQSGEDRPGFALGMPIR